VPWPDVEEGESPDTSALAIRELLHQIVSHTTTKEVKCPIYVFFYER